MATEYLITMDTHCRTTDVCVKTRGGKLVKRVQLTTGIPQLRELIESIPRPRRVAFEEGPLAGWLYRNLKESAQEVVVCNPRRNAHVAKDGDKDDAIDAEKLNDLYRGGYFKPVHQLASVEQAAAKQMVGIYHQRVVRRVAEGLRLLSLARRWGVALSRSQLLDEKVWPEVQRRLHEAGVPPYLELIAQGMWDGFQQLVEQEVTIHRAICRLVRQTPVMARTTELPGYGPVRAATLIIYLDTPWRFKSKEALWKYVGIGLKRQKSGTGLDVVGVEQECNRLLRNMVIGAAQRAIEQKENVFAERYARWVAKGLSTRNARRNVARDQVTAVWGMWKSGRAFDADLLGKASTQRH